MLPHFLPFGPGQNIYHYGLGRVVRYVLYVRHTMERATYSNRNTKHFPLATQGLPRRPPTPVAQAEVQLLRYAS